MDRDRRSPGTRPSPPCSRRGCDRCCRDRPRRRCRPPRRRTCRRPPHKRRPSPHHTLRRTPRSGQNRCRGRRRTRRTAAAGCPDSGSRVAGRSSGRPHSGCRLRCGRRFRSPHRTRRRCRRCRRRSSPGSRTGSCRSRHTWRASAMSVHRRRPRGRASAGRASGRSPDTLSAFAAACRFLVLARVTALAAMTGVVLGVDALIAARRETGLARADALAALTDLEGAAVAARSVAAVVAAGVDRRALRHVLPGSLALHFPLPFPGRTLLAPARQGQEGQESARQTAQQPAPGGAGWVGKGTNEVVEPLLVHGIAPDAARPVVAHRGLTPAAGQDHAESTGVPTGTATALHAPCLAPIGTGKGDGARHVHDSGSRRVPAADGPSLAPPRRGCDGARWRDPTASPTGPQPAWMPSRCGSARRRAARMARASVRAAGRQRPHRRSIVSQHAASGRVGHGAAALGTGSRCTW